MKSFRTAFKRCAQHQSGVETACPEISRDISAMQPWISKWLMHKCNFDVIKLSPSRRAARGNAHSDTLFPQPSTVLSTRIVDKGEILTLPATCAALLLTPAAMARKFATRSRGVPA
jgi:hypothetical protein